MALSFRSDPLVSGVRITAGRLCTSANCPDTQSGFDPSPYSILLKAFVEKRRFFYALPFSSDPLVSGVRITG